MNTFDVEIVPISSVRPHPRNYRVHPDDQIAHLIESIKENGLYRNIVVARDGTILSGHGVTQAAKKMGLESIPVVRLDLDPSEPRALKVLAGDNEIGHLAEIDDRLLSEILKEVKDSDIEGLLGTGYDEAMLANLVFVTRPESEIQDMDEAAAWVGMPEYEQTQEALKITVSFRNENDRAEFARILNINITEKTRSSWWPDKEKDDVSSVKFKG
jgi:ParB-like chromosome segregation protein Spo0J